VHIFKVRFVLADLGGWVKHIAQVASNPRHHFVASARVLAFIPLFEFNNNGVLATPIISACD
jgi:hypothetical protein